MSAARSAAAAIRRRYGAGPLHLLALLASFALAGAAVVRWFDSGSDVIKVLAWFAGAIIAHDLVLLPLYSLIERIAFGAPMPGPAPERAPARVYVRVPALLSGLLLIVFLPDIAQLGSTTFHAASGLHQNGYLVRWLAASGTLFALSGLAYVLTRRGAGRQRTRASRRQSPPER